MTKPHLWGKRLKSFLRSIHYMPIEHRISLSCLFRKSHGAKLLMLWLFCWCVVAQPLTAQEVQPGWSTNDTTLSKAVRTLRADLNDIIADSASNSASVSVYVYSIKNKELLYSRNEMKAFVPASNVKLFTTAAALEYLGQDFTYTTTVFLDGIIKANGEYIGNLIIRGAGDPSMSSYFMPEPMSVLQRWAATFDSLGIKSIRGNIIGDNSYFDDAPLGAGWSWDDVPYSFSAEISALSFNDNKVDVVVRPGTSVGIPAETAILPTTTYISVANKVITVAADSTRSVDYWRDMTSNVVELTGTMPLDSTHKKEPRIAAVTVHNPAQFMLTLFKQTLKERGITVNGEVFDLRQWGNKKISYTELRPVCEQTSPPLAEIIRVVNMTSHNLCAEMLLRTIGKETSGKGSADKGMQAVREFCKQREISVDGSSFVDGSGLSRFNIVTAKQLGSLLTAMYNSKHRAVFMKSLASPTERSTLFGRMKNSLAERAVRAKTGSLNGVSALSGYVTSRDQEPIAFALVFNNFTVPQSDIRSIQDFFCMRLASFSRK